MGSAFTKHLTMSEAIDALSDGQRPGGFQLSSVENSSSMSWDLNTSFESARQLAEFGWKEKGAELEKYLAIVQQVLQENWAVSLDVSGECVDIGAYLDGEPECMMTFLSPEPRSVKIIANISARSSADAPRLLNRGIAIAAAVYTLQAGGVGVSLSVGDWVRSGSAEHATTIEVNPFGDYIDPARLAFWLGHPAALRRCIFRYNEQESSDIRRTFGFSSGGGYGTPVDPDKAQFKEAGVVFLPFPETSALALYETPHRAFETVRAILKEQGVDLMPPLR